MKAHVLALWIFSCVICWVVPATEAQAAPSRAIWIWEAQSYSMVENPAVADEAIDFMKKSGIDTLYLYADAFQNRNLIVESPALYRAFIERAHRQGMRVYALLGSAYLNTETYILPERRADALAMFQRVLTYNQAAPRRARFDGVNMDIEPHILDAWNADTRLELLRQFLDMSAMLMQLKKTYGVELAVGPAIPFWLDGLELEWRGQRKPVSEHAIDIYDYVALMDYRDKADGSDGIIDHASSEIAYANRTGKKVVIGLETTKNDINKVTFHEEGPLVMEREITKVTEALNQEPSFAGYALHHYGEWRKWLGRTWP
jgi:hypothetical protein